jgi:hypothetical protein
MPCAQPVVIPASNSTEPSIINERSILRGDEFPSNRLHRIVLDADDSIKRLNARLRSEKERLLTALTTLKSRIDAGSPVENRETFASISPSSG